MTSDGLAGVRGERWDEREPSANVPSPPRWPATWDVGCIERLGGLLAAECLAPFEAIVREAALGPGTPVDHAPRGAQPHPPARCRPALLRLPSGTGTGTEVTFLDAGGEPSATEERLEPRLHSGWAASRRARRSTWPASEAGMRSTRPVDGVRAYAMGIFVEHRASGRERDGDRPPAHHGVARVPGGRPAPRRAPRIGDRSRRALARGLSDRRCARGAGGRPWRSPCLAGADPLGRRGGRMAIEPGLRAGRRTLESRARRARRGPGPAARRRRTGGPGGPPWSDPGRSGERYQVRFLQPPLLGVQERVTVPFAPRVIVNATFVLVDLAVTA